MNLKNCIAKLDLEINKKRYKELKEKMIENIIDKYSQLANLDTNRKVILDFHPYIIPAQYIYYFFYTREIWLLFNKYAGNILNKLINVTEDRQKAKGLNKYIL